MPGKENSQNEISKEAAKSSAVSVPAISLPRGGGAIRGIGEKFAANPVTGTASFSVPIAVTPGRSGFSPQLSLSYDSGSGNGPFGFGWSLSIPSITRKTDKGLPKYEDANESDVFILSGAEDLVPVLVHDRGEWRRETFNRMLDDVEYTVQRYRPRSEGLFARIEKWTDKNNGDIHWRSISKDNITTIYGKDNNSRIFEQDDPNPEHPGRIFSWLICQSYDDKGNAIVYEYVPENSAGVDLSLVHEKNRTPGNREANRYLKRIKYGNLPSRLQEPDLSRLNWLFELVFDYGEGHYHELPMDTEGRQWVRAVKNETMDWPVRQDPFSTYRPGFEVRTYRLCRRLLMFHHFPEELDREDYLVRSTEFTYRQTPVASFIDSMTQSGYVLRGEEENYLKKSLPPLEFTYSQARIDDRVHTVDKESLENLPMGLDGSQYRWVDLDGEGLSGILTEQADAWYFKANRGNAQFEPLQPVTVMPASAKLGQGRQQLLDLAGDGKLDLVQFSDPLPGFYEHNEEEGWEQFRPFECCPNIDWNEPNLKFIDLNGDGHADILISEDHVFTWYSSLAEQGFGASETVLKLFDEEKGPALVFEDGTQSVYLSDISGDGLPDIARIRNGEVCYWPNLGYGRFGAKVTMEDSPWFDRPDQFDQKRVRLADIDGSGTTDIIYLGCEQISIYFNQSGNGWSEVQHLAPFPHVDNLTAVTAVDLKGNGTVCLVCSSYQESDKNLQMRYIDLMGDQKPHLLTMIKNNMGSETVVHYTASTKFYLQDHADGKPWITRLPFPVHVVERVETFDRISKNRFVTRYAYHHGYFDGHEREFRGFGMVEQWDTEEIGTPRTDDSFSSPEAVNLDEASYVPPVLTRTWFHTGAYIKEGKISRQFKSEYYREPGLTDDQYEALLLPDTVLPGEITLSDNTGLPCDLNPEELREACRVLKGSILRREVYAQDGTEKSEMPYTVSERIYQLKWLQPRGTNKNAVFFAHPGETIDYHYERTLYKENPDDPDSPEVPDPRISHRLNLETDVFGNILKSAAVGYGRRLSDMNLEEQDREKQTKTLMIYTENTPTIVVAQDDAWRTPLICETVTYELTGPVPGEGARFSLVEMLDAVTHAVEIPYESIPDGTRQKRRVEHVRTLYRSDNLSGPLRLREVESMALPYETYKLAFTPGLLEEIYIRSGKIDDTGLVDILAGEGGYLVSNELKAEDLFPDTDRDGHWWMPSGRAYFSPNEEDSPGEELAYAQQHFFLPHRFLDPFRNISSIQYDRRDLLLIKTIDPIGNVITVETKDDEGNDIIALDYRVMQAWLIVDPNDNRSAVAFDALGMVVGTVVMGKYGEIKGDSLEGFETDLDDGTIQAHILEPLNNPHEVLNRATTRLVYDLHRYSRTCDTENPQPNVVYTISRETHDADLETGQQTKVRHSFLYSDGFSRKIQEKVQAEPGPLVEGGPIFDSRWVGSGWTIYNNKGKPVKKYEPFFTPTHSFEIKMEGVGSTLFYDPVERVVATLHPHHSYEKIDFAPWRQETWDVNDTVLQVDPKEDPDVGDFFRRLAYDEYLPAWYTPRQDGTLGPAEQDAAEKTALHANTPAIVYLDTLGRIFLTINDNGPAEDGTEQKYETRIELDIEGNKKAVFDARGNRVMQYAYSIKGMGGEEEEEEEDEERQKQVAGHRIYRNSMDAGERWMINNVMGNPFIRWDGRGHQFSHSYDELQRLILIHVYGSDGEISLDNDFERILYGDWKNMSPTQRMQSKNNNLIGKPGKHYDTAGKIQFEDYDFKGNLLKSNRRLTFDYKNVPDWGIDNTDDLLEAEQFTTETQYDALNRVTQSKTPDGSILQSFYNEAQLLERLEVTRNSITTSFVKNIDYNEKGQRTSITYGNNVTTTYQYHRETFRLIHLQTKRLNNELLQDLYYTYDPAGNITRIEDKNIPEVFSSNQKIEGISQYTYDPLYRLVQASGREYAGTPGFGSNDNWGDLSFQKKYSRGTTMEWRNYTRFYRYDEAGNIRQMRHTANGSSWTRTYDYEDVNNRLRSSTVPGHIYAYHHHPQHGFIDEMPHLQIMQWNFNDEFKAASQQRRTDGGTPETTHYVYDASGQRVRKVTDNAAAPGITPSKKGERIYVDGIEIYREYRGETIELERQTLHVMGDTRRIAMIEMRTHGDDGSPEKLTRYQLASHLGSACLETDDSTNARIISYEEYYPFGTTSYQAVDKDIRAAAKRYRYTGKERDKESGFYYHGARYYAPFLGRWVSPDPIGMEDGLNLYRYSRNNPVKFTDTTGFGVDQHIDQILQNRGAPPPTGLPFTVNIQYTSPGGRPSTQSPRPRSRPGEAYQYVAQIAIAYAREIHASMPQGDVANRDPGEVFIRLMLELAEGESQGTFLQGAAAHAPSSSAMGVFSLNRSAWIIMRRRLGLPNGSRYTVRQSTPFEEIAIPIRFYAEEYRNMLQETGSALFAARHVFALHTGGGTPHHFLPQWERALRDWRRRRRSTGQPELAFLEARWRRITWVNPYHGRPQVDVINERLQRAGIVTGGQNVSQVSTPHVQRYYHRLLLRPCPF